MVYASYLDRLIHEIYSVVLQCDDRENPLFFWQAFFCCQPFVFTLQLFILNRTLLSVEYHLNWNLVRSSKFLRSYLSESKVTSKKLFSLKNKDVHIRASGRKLCSSKGKLLSTVCSLLKITMTTRMKTNYSFVALYEKHYRAAKCCFLG